MSRLNVANFRHPDGTDDNINLTSTGRVGINESTPDRALHVNSANQNECAKFESTDTEVTLEFTDTTGTAALKCRNDFRFNTSSSTEICRIESGGNMQFNSGYGSVATAYGVRAWAQGNCNTDTIVGSGNVSSITEIGGLEHQFNYSTAITDANYSIVATSGGISSATGDDSNASLTSSAVSTTSCRVRVNASNAYMVNIAVFR